MNMAKKRSGSKNTQESSIIKQGSVAEFFRKRTQLVGFDFGLNKHTQYAIEFLDNALDAIERFQWKQIKIDPEIAYSLKYDVILENFSYFNPIFEDELKKIDAQQAKASKAEEQYFITEENSDVSSTPVSLEDRESDLIVEDSAVKGKKEDLDDEEAKNIRKLQKKAEELEDEVQNIIWGLESFLYPIKAMVEQEPFVIIQITERDPKDVFADSAAKGSKEVFEYTLDVFDNGTGMIPGDLESFGKYLASSKSQKLKQTRGSQGFGSPSAFSDAQNTTGQPVTVVSKDLNRIYGICSQFYTTSKNNKEYVVPPTEVTTPFEHGTYISLQYLNVKYKRGYMDLYIKQTALTNPHITFIFLDPLGNEEIYPRRVGKFPREPTYALAHPSSVNIGDFQDLLRSSTNLTVTAFLQDNFVRLSSSLAKTIVQSSENDLEKTLSVFNVPNGYISWTGKTQPFYFIRLENRIFGRSKKAREKFVVYQITDEDNLQSFWDWLKSYRALHSKIEKNQKQIRQKQKSILKESDKKLIKELKKSVVTLDKASESTRKEILFSKKKLFQIGKDFKVSSANEITDVKVTDKIEDNINELMISNTRPNQLTQKQTENLFKLFKAQKYMAPPSDPAVPIGASILETTMLKEYHLTPSHRTDLFLDDISTLSSLTKKESSFYPSRILAKMTRFPYLDPEFQRSQVYLWKETMDKSDYVEFFQKFDVLHTVDEDFICGHTRPPTSGKGLAFVVEAVVAISSKIPFSKKAQQVLMRYVNRTPKMRDNSDCAIWKGVQSVKWRNYKLDVFDNGIPKGNIRIVVNVSGPYVHLMFKSQAKSALAEDEVLMKEIKFCLEAIGRKIRTYQNKRVNRDNLRKRSKVIEKFIPIFVSSLLSIAHDMDDHKKVRADALEQRLLDRLEGRIKDPEGTTPVSPTQKGQLVVKREEEGEDEPKEKLPAAIKHFPKKISYAPRPTAGPSYSTSKEIYNPPKIKPVVSKRQAVKVHTPPKPVPSRSTQKTMSAKPSIRTSKPLPRSAPIPRASASSPTKLVKPKSIISLITTDRIMQTMVKDQWYNIKDLIKALRITDIKDGRYLQLKLKQLTRERNLLVSVKSGKTYYKKHK